MYTKQHKKNFSTNIIPLTKTSIYISFLIIIYQFNTNKIVINTRGKESVMTIGIIYLSDDSGTKHATIDYNADVIQLEIGDGRVGRGDDIKMKFITLRYYYGG